MPDPDVTPRRILWLSHFLPWPPKGGLHQRSYYLMRGVGHRHDVQLIAFRQRAHQADEGRRQEALDALSQFARVREVFDLPEDRKRWGRVRLAARSLLPGPPYTVRWGSCPGFAGAVRAAVEDFRPEVVHFDTVSLAPYLNLVGETPSVLNHHNVESHMLLRRAHNEPSLARRLYFLQEGRRLEAYERRVAGRFGAHLVCAEPDGQRLRDAVGPVPVRVVPNGVDLKYFRPPPPGTPTRPQSLIFVGGLSWYPNASAIRFFVRRVWPELTRVHPLATLTVVGADPPPDLFAFSEKDHRVSFPGFVDDMRPLVHGSSVYVCPIFDGGGTKLKMLDAMAMGRAIVAHPVACEGLRLKDGEQVLMASSPEEFLACISRLFQDVSLRASLGERGRRHVEEHFSFETIGRDLSRFLEDVASRGGTRTPST